MAAEATPELAREWRGFRFELELAKNYPRPYMLYVLRTHRNPLLDRLLPGLLYLKAVSLLDDALEQLIHDRGLDMPRAYQASLKGRIEYLADQGVLGEQEKLHAVRARRNDLAHDASAGITWTELDADVELVEGVLARLSLVRLTGKLEFFMERSAMRETKRPGYAYEQEFKYGLRENGKLAVEVTWTEFMEAP